MIWLIGGTSSSREVADLLREESYDFIISVATSYGKKLYDISDKVVEVRMDREQMVEFIRKNNITTVIDATHPYAIEVSSNAMQACEAFEGISYIRYERKTLEYRGGISFGGYKEMRKYLEGTNGNILVTVGSNNLEEFMTLKDRCYFRVLPVVTSLEKSKVLGISPKNTIALQGPFSKEFNRAIIRNYGIKYLVTKESGSEGGELEKVDASLEEGVKLVVLSRPKLDYPKLVYAIKELKKIIKR